MAEPLTVLVDGRRVTAAAGASVAATLLDHGIWALHGSPSGAARGPLCGMGICFECRVWIDGRAHQRACMTPCTEGMRVETMERSDG